MIEHWFAIRTKPGTQRMASTDEGLPEARREEFVIERQCRDEGFEIFTPSFWTRTKHARTNKILVKRLPLFTGYSFVNLPLFQFEQLRNEVDGVINLLRTVSGPFEFPSSLIGNLRVDEWKERQEFLFATHEANENERLEEIRHLRGSLRKIMPRGRAVRVNMMEQADRQIASLQPRARHRAEAILARLKELTEERTLEETAEAV